MNETGKSTRGGALDAQRERAVVTRAAILQAARSRFAEAGYHATGTTDIAALAEMTRGALYHHFADKVDLFAEVFRAVAEELVSQANSSVAPLSGDLWAQVGAAFKQYLRLVAKNREYQRILLIDGPSVLGWSRWRQLQSEFIASGTVDALEMLIERGLVAQQPTEPLANLLQAALNDAALTIANSNDPEQASEEVGTAFLALLSGLQRTNENTA